MIYTWLHTRAEHRCHASERYPRAQRRLWQHDHARIDMVQPVLGVGQGTGTVVGDLAGCGLKCGTQVDNRVIEHTRHLKVA